MFIAFYKLNNFANFTSSCANEEKDCNKNLHTDDDGDGVLINSKNTQQFLCQM